jgi:glycosyltransferase involved in cell wall biosynthesis
MQAKVLMLMWADPNRYPPTVNAANCFAETGVMVTLVGREEGHPQVGQSPYADGVLIKRIRHDGSSRFGRAISLARFLWASARESARLKPTIVIGYDNFGLIGAKLAQIANPKARLVFHSHDVQPASNWLSLGGFAWNMERVLARTASIVVLPDTLRAAAYARLMRLKAQPLVVPNAPRLRESSNATNTLRSMVPELSRGIVVVRHGSIGPGHAIETTIRSMREWPQDVWLVLVGAAEPEYLSKLKGLASDAGIANRFLVLPFRPYPEILDLVSEADIGLALYDGPEQSGDWAFAGTASNKALEYLAAGIPFVVNDYPASAVFVEHGVAVSVDVANAVQLASAIKALSDKRERLEMTSRALALHRDHLNFEHGFAQLQAALQLPMAAKP